MGNHHVPGGFGRVERPVEEVKLGSARRVGGASLGFVDIVRSAVVFFHKARGVGDVEADGGAVVCRDICVVPTGKERMQRKMSFRFILAQQNKKYSSN